MYIYIYKYRQVSVHVALLNSGFSCHKTSSAFHAVQAVKDREEARPQVPTPPPVGEPRVKKMVQLWPEIPSLQALKVTLLIDIYRLYNLMGRKQVITSSWS